MKQALGLVEREVKKFDKQWSDGYEQQYLLEIKAYIFCIVTIQYA